MFLPHTHTHTHTHTQLYEVIEVLTNPTVIIILIHMHVSNHHIVHLKLTQCYPSVISQYSWKNIDHDFKTLITC